MHSDMLQMVKKSHTLNAPDTKASLVFNSSENC